MCRCLLTPAALTRIRRSSRARWRGAGRWGGCGSFRQKLYECLDARADALFELADAILCADHAVTSLVQLSTEPEFTRGHGALYDALAEGRIDDEKLFSLLAAELPPARGRAGGNRAWIAERDVIDHGLLDTVLARAARRRGGAGPGRVRPLVPAAVRRRRDRLSPAGRLVLPGPRARAQRRLPLQGLVQDHAGLGVPVHRRRSGTCAPRGPRSADVARTTPATRTAQTIAQVKNVLRRTARCRARDERPPRCSSSTPATAPPPSPTASWDARLHILVRLAAGSVFHAEPVTWAGKVRPPAPARSRRALPGACGLRRCRHRGQRPAGPEGAPPAEPRNPDEDAHPAGHPALRHRHRRGLARCPPAHPRRPWLVRRPGASSRSCAAPSSTSPSSACPTAATRTAPCGCGTPAPGPCPWTSSGAPTWPVSTLSTSSSS